MIVMVVWLASIPRVAGIAEMRRVIIDVILIIQVIPLVVVQDMLDVN